MSDFVSYVMRSVNNDINEITTFLQTLDEEKIRWNPTGEEWSIMQVTSHICESIPFWLEEIERVRKDSSTKIGEYRSFFSQERLAVLTKEYNQNTTIDKAIKKLGKTLLLINKTLESLTDKQFQNKKIQFIVDIEILRHIKGHLNQIKRNLSDREKLDFPFNE